MYFPRNEFQEAFRTEFQNLQQLRTELGNLDDNPNMFDAAAVRAAEDELEVNMLATLGRLEKIPEVIGNVVMGGRHSLYYFSGEGQPTTVHRNPFRNFPFRGILRGVEAVTPPDSDSGLLEVTLHVAPINSGLHTQHGYEVNEEVWVPFGGLDVDFDQYSHLREEAA